MKQSPFLLGLACLIMAGVGCTAQVDKEVPEITREELSGFVPVNYELVKDSYSDKISIIKIGDFYVLPLTATGGNEAGASAKILVLSYDSKKDSYESISSYEGSGDAVVELSNYFDVDRDGTNELFVVFQQTGVSGYRNTVEVLKLEENALSKMVATDILNEKYYQYDPDTRELVAATFIWAEGETHYGCHHFEIKKRTFDGEKFVDKGTIATKKKYDMGDAQNDNIKCFEAPDFISEILEIEGF